MGPGWPFGPGGFDLSQMFRMLQSEGPVHWEVAQQVAAWVAVSDSGTPRPQAPLDDAAVRALTDLARAAQAHVAQATGLADVLGLAVRCTDRQGWARGTLDGLHPVLEALARSLGRPLAGEAAAGGEADPLQGFFGALAPMLLGVQAGSMIGFLAQHALGQYDRPLPLTGAPALVFVPANVDAFADAWSLTRDDLRFALALREAVHAAPRTVPWVGPRLVRLASAYVSAYETDSPAIEALGDLDPADPSSFAAIVADPNALLGAMRSPAQAPILDDLRRFVAVLEGYTDTVAARVGGPLVTSYGQIDEALRRHRVERGEAASFVDRLLGLELDRSHYEAGVAFCDGVVERAGPNGVDRLWEAETMLPTRPELEAPGLWLARIEL